MVPSNNGVFHPFLGNRALHEFGAIVGQIVNRCHYEWTGCGLCGSKENSRKRFSEEKNEKIKGSSHCQQCTLFVHTPGTTTPQHSRYNCLKKEISCIIYHHLLLLFLPFQGMFSNIACPSKSAIFFKSVSKNILNKLVILIICCCYCCCYPVSILRLIENHRCNVPNQKFLLLSLS